MDTGFIGRADQQGKVENHPLSERAFMRECMQLSLGMGDKSAESLWVRICG